MQLTKRLVESQVLATSDEQKEVFFGLAAEVCNEINRFGYGLTAADLTTKTKFDSLSNEAKRHAIDSLLAYSKVCASAIEEGKELRDSPNLLWHAIKSLGLIPCSDLFSTLEQGDVIEIYTPDFKQAFRNFEFYRISSYPFSYMNLYQWNELYKRDDTITTQIVEYGLKLFSGAIKSTIWSEVPPHYLEELISKDKLKLKMQQKVFSPLLDRNGGVGGVVATSRVEIVDTALINQ